VTERRAAQSHAADGTRTAAQDQQIGTFCFVFATDRWAWSDNTYRIHGYTPNAHPFEGEENPLTTGVVLGHVHCEDRGRVAAKLLDTDNRAAPFTSRHRLIDASGHERNVLLVANPLRDETGATVGIQGFYIQNAEQIDPELAVQQRITAEVERISQSRETIDQAKGMLMAIYGLNSEAAFRILRGWSQTSNTKLHTLAEHLIANFTELGSGSELPPRSRYQQAIHTIRDQCEPARSANSGS
jgi:hypothetical protein